MLCIRLLSLELAICLLSFLSAGLFCDVGDVSLRGMSINTNNEYTHLSFLALNVYIIVVVTFKSQSNIPTCSSKTSPS